MLVTLLLFIIRSVGQSVAACLHVVKYVKWSSFVADRITLLCMCVCVLSVYTCEIASVSVVDYSETSAEDQSFMRG